jgi:effector-binding domain-containing protein
MTVHVWMAATLIIGLVSVAWAEPAATQPAGGGEPPAFHASTPIYKEIKPMKRYVHASATTNIPGIKETVKKNLDPLLTKHGSLVKGPLIFVYHGITPDPKRNFDMEMGFAAWEDPKDLGGFKVRPLDAFKCVSVYYTGSYEHVGNAYEQIFPALFRMGYKPTAENREVYLYWEDDTSPNNVTEIQIGVTK